MTAFEDFVNLELPRRSTFLTKAITSYDADPNLGGAPAILQGAPLGTWFYEETADKWWRKKNATPTGWVDVSPGGGGGTAADIVRTYDVGVTVRDAVYQKSDGKAARTNASSYTTSEGFLGFVAAIDSPSAGQCEIRRFGDLSGFSGLTVGETYVLSTAAGGIVAVSSTSDPNYPPSGGGVLRPVAIPSSSTSLCVIAGAWLLEL